MSLSAVFLSVIVSVCLLVGVAVYNNLVSLKKQIDRAWSNIEILLKQRFDEIPKLIEVVEQYASYEQNILQRVIAARSGYSLATSVASKIAASNEISLALKGLVALAESYPDLKANPSFLQLQSRVSELESQISGRREFFNETVTNFNTRIAQIPDIFLAGTLGYKECFLYHPPAIEMTAPSLKMKVG